MADLRIIFRHIAGGGPKLAMEQRENRFDLRARKPMAWGIR